MHTHNIAKPIQIDPRLQPVVYEGPTVPSGAVDVRLGGTLNFLAYVCTYVYAMIQP